MHAYQRKQLSIKDGKHLSIKDHLEVKQWNSDTKRLLYSRIVNDTMFDKDEKKVILIIADYIFYFHILKK